MIIYGQTGCQYLSRNNISVQLSEYMRLEKEKNTQQKRFLT